MTPEEFQAVLSRKDNTIELLQSQIQQLQQSVVTLKAELEQSNRQNQEIISALTARLDAADQPPAEAAKPQTTEEPQNNPAMETNYPEDGFTKVKDRKRKPSPTKDRGYKKSAGPKGQPTTNQQQPPPTKKRGFQVKPPTPQPIPVIAENNNLQASSPQSQKQGTNHQAARKAKIPPIVIRDKNRYNQIATHLKANNVDYGDAVNLREGIKIHPKTQDAYRFIQNFQDTNQEQYHSFAFAEEKKLHIVLRGVLEQWDTEFVNNNLLEQGYHPTNVIRYFNGNGFPTPLVLVLFPIQERDKVFHELKAINGIRIRVETQI